MSAKSRYNPRPPKRNPAPPPPTLQPLSRQDVIDSTRHALRIIGSNKWVTKIPHDFEHIVECGWDEVIAKALTYQSAAVADRARASDPDRDSIMVEEVRP